MEFETDSLVVNSLSSHSLDCSEYGFLISDCVRLRGNGNYSIQFIKRQTNKCVHVLTRHVFFNASLYEYFVIPSWLEEVILSDLSSIYRRFFIIYQKKIYYSCIHVSAYRCNNIYIYIYIYIYI